MRRPSEKLAAPRGHDHELLQVDRVVGVGAAVDHVHHRHREHGRRRRGSIRRARRCRDTAAPRPRPPRRARSPARRRGSRSRRGATCSGSRRARAAPRRSRPGRWPGAPASAFAIVAVDVLDRLRHALAGPVVAAVAQLGRLELAGRGARGHRGAALGAGPEPDLDLDRRVAAGVEDLAGVDVLDRAHLRPVRLAGGLRSRSAAARRASSGSIPRPRASRTASSSISPTAASVSSRVGAVRGRARPSGSARRSVLRA